MIKTKEVSETVLEQNSENTTTEFIKNQKLKKWLPFIITFCSLTVFYLIVGLCNGFTYFINDDKTIMEILSGKYITHTSHYGIFISQLICYPLKLLYQIMPNIPFHGLTLIFFSYACLIIVGTFLINTDSKNMFVTSLCLFFGITFIAMLFQIINPQYTTTAIFPMFAILILLAKYPQNATKLKKVLYYILIFLLATYACALRVRVFELCLFFVAFVLFYNLVKRKQKWTSVLLVVVLCISSFGLNKIIDNAVLKNDVEYQKYIEYNAARTQIYDHYDFPEYAEAKEFYDSLGISEDCVELLKCYAIDLEELSLDNLKAIAEYQKEHLNKAQAIGDALTTSLLQYFNKYNLAETLTIALFVLYLLFGCERKGKFNYIYLGLLFLATIVLGFLIALLMKFPARVCSCLTFGVIASMIPIYFDVTPKQNIFKENSKAKRVANKALKCVFALSASICFIWSLTISVVFNSIAQSYADEQKAVFAYTKTHAEQTFILANSVTTTQTGLLLDSPTKSNNVYYSSWNSRSPYNKEWFENLGYKDYSDLIENCDNLRLIVMRDNEGDRYKNYFEQKYNKTLILETLIEGYDYFEVYIVADL